MSVGISIDDLGVRSLDTDVNEVTWCVLDTQEDVHDYTFQVLRSESPEGPFDVVSGAFEDRYFFIDSRIPFTDKFQTLHYKIRVVQKRTGDTKDFGPCAQSAEPDLIANHVRRSQLTLLTQVIGRKVWLFPRRTFGQRCPTCWDPQLKQQIRTQCLDCYDTTYLRGYMDPIEIFVQIDPGTKNYQLQSQQLDQQVQVTARTSYYPSIKPSDVLVEMENKRWRVTAVTNSERLRATIKQELQLRELQRSDIEFRLPINLDRALKDVQASPGKMFTNPFNLDNLDVEEIPNPFAIYDFLSEND